MQLWKVRSNSERLVDKALLALGTCASGVPQSLCYKMNIPLPSREHIPLLAEAMGLQGEGVEVGVFEGYFSERILTDSKLNRLYSIDPWREFSKSEYPDRANTKQSELDARFEQVSERLERFGERSKILRTTSKEAAKQFAPASLDFVYIDANHTFEGCLADLQSWWPKLRPGGLIAGDDYCDGVLSGTNYGVKSAVSTFFNELDQPFQHTYQALHAHWPNWYAVKQEISHQ